MKAGWKTVKLGEACEILDSKRRPVTKADRRSGPYPYFGATGIQDYVDQFIFDEPLVLLGEDGAKWKSGDRSAFKISGKTWVNNHAHVLRPRRDVILDDWLVYWLNHSDLTDFVTGVTVPKLNQANMVKIPIPLPPLAEQKWIVALLDEAFAGIDEAMAKAETNANNSMALWNAILHSTFSGNDRDWPLITLDDCCSKVTDGTHHSPKVQFSQRLSGTYPYVTSKNIRNNYIDLSKISYVEESFHREVYSRCKPAVGDVLLTKDGANTGQVVVNTIDEPFSLLSSVCLLKPEREMLSPHFLCYFLQSPQGTSSLVSEMTGAAIKRLILKTIKKATIPLPPLDEQNRLIKFLDEGRKLAERLHTNNERSIKLYTELKASLLSQAFTGELTA